VITKIREEREKQRRQRPELRRQRHRAEVRAQRMQAKEPVKATPETFRERGGSARQPIGRKIDVRREELSQRYGQLRKIA